MLYSTIEKIEFENQTLRSQIDRTSQISIETAQKVDHLEDAKLEDQDAIKEL